MGNMFLNEYIGRMGIVTHSEITAHAGEAQDTLKLLVALLNRRDIFLCRIGKDEESILSRHLLFCLKAVYSEPESSANAQDLYDWVSDNEYSTLKDAQSYLKFKNEEFEKAANELQQHMLIAPVYVSRMYHRPRKAGKNEFLDYYECLWVTNYTWISGLRRPERYKDLGYCISEVRRMLQRRFTSREIESLIFKGYI